MQDFSNRKGKYSLLIAISVFLSLSFSSAQSNLENKSQLTFTKYAAKYFAIDINSTNNIYEKLFCNKLISKLSVFAAKECGTQILPDSFLTIKNSNNLIIDSSESREIGVVGKPLTIPFIKELPRLLSGTLNSDIFNRDKIASYANGFNLNIPRLVEVELLPIKQYKSFVLNPHTASAATEIAQQNKSLPFVDILSLALYCKLASFNSQLDQSRCNYEIVSSGLLTSSVSNDVGQLNTSTLSDVVSTSTTTKDNFVSTTTPTTSDVLYTNTDKSSIPTPIYINQYITKYIEGPAGKDGRDGANGKDGRDGKDFTQSAGAFGGYVTPSQPTNTWAAQSLIGVSTISYLRDATVEYSTFNYGTSTSLSLISPNIRNSVFNGGNIFNDQAIFTGTTSINNLVSTSTTLVSATSTNHFIENLQASSSNLTNASITNGTTTNLFSTNSFTTNSTSTNSFISNLQATTANISNFFGTNSTSTNLFVTNGTSTNLFTQNLAVGNSQTAGNQSISGTLNVNGTTTLGSNTTIQGSVTIGTSTSNFITVNGLLNSNLIPASNISYDLGSPSLYYRNVYVGTITANSISAASTSIAGTVSSSFTLNSGNVTADTQDSSLIFFRGISTPNAVFKWNSTTKRLEANQSFKVENETPVTGTTTFTIQSGQGQGSSNLLELRDNSGTLLSFFNSAGGLSVGGNSTTTGLFNVIGTSTLATTTVTNLSVSGHADFTNASTTAITSNTFYTTDLKIVNASSSNFTNSGNAYFSGLTSGSIPFIGTGGLLSQNNSNLFWDNTNSRFGVGTTTPSAKFSINANVGDTNTNLFSISSSTAAANLLTFSNSGQLTLDPRSTAYDTLPFIKFMGSAGGLAGGIGGANGQMRFYNANGLARIIFGTSDLAITPDFGTTKNLSVGTEVGANSYFGGTGNVGIGTTSPQSKLSVSGAIRLDGPYQLQFWNTSGSAGNSIQLDNAASSNPGLSFNTGGAQRMLIDTSGNVGIGTTTPVAKLDVWGNLNVGTSSTPALFVNSGTGNIGVGSSNPTSQLYLLGSKTGSVGNYITYQNTGASDISTGFDLRGRDGAGNEVRFLAEASRGGDVRLNAVSNNPLLFMTNNTENMRISATGNIGIGTTSPSAKLDVWGNLNVGTSSTPSLFVNSGLSRVGVGTNSPSQNLSVIGAGYVSGAWGVGVVAANNVSALRVDGSTASSSATFMGGNVGIGISTPTSLLHVGGTFTGNTSAAINLGPTFVSNNTTQQSILQAQSQISPTGASLSAAYGIINLPSFSNSATPISVAFGNFSRIDTAASYTGVISNGRAFASGDPSNLSGIPFTNYSQYYADPLTNGNGTTTGTINNYGLNLNGITAASAGSSNINNYTTSLVVPSGSPSGGTTNNYGLRIVGNGGTSSGGTVNNFSLYNSSTANSYFAGSIGIGTTTPVRKLEVTEANTVAQLRLSKTSSVYADLVLDNAGDLTFNTTGYNIKALSNNLYICDNAGCPTLTATSTAGNIFVENAQVFGNNFSLNQTSSTSLGMFDHSGTLIVTFDEAP